MKKGMTLIEIMVVVVILGIIAAVVAANIGGKDGVAKARLTAAQIKLLRADVELFKVDHNRYPANLEELVRRPADINPKDWHEYRCEVPLDGWNRPFRYQVPGTRGPYDIVSLGEDGKEGGDGVDADLWSHPPR
jgi:general secretion pathway protein G